MSEQDAKLEIACRWFDAGTLAIGHAARLAGLSVVQFETELQRRGIPRFRDSEEMLEQDLEALKRLGRW